VHKALTKIIFFKRINSILSVSHPPLQIYLGTNYAIHPAKQPIHTAVKWHLWLRRLGNKSTKFFLFHLIRNIHENRKGTLEDTGASISSHPYYFLFQISTRYELCNMMSQKARNLPPSPQSLGPRSINQIYEP
jgi:hypothetical protein